MNIQSLLHRLFGREEPISNERKVYNPLRAKIGDSFSINRLDYRGKFYVFTSLVVLDRGTGVLLADYNCNDGDSSLLLRTVPRGAVVKDKLDIRILILSYFYECSWDDELRAGIMQGVSDPSGEFVINAGTADEKRYWRLYGLKDPQHVKATTYKDVNGNGIVDDNEVKTKELLMWAFSRVTEDEAKQEVTEYLYVEKDEETGWLEIYTGVEVPPECIFI